MKWNSMIYFALALYAALLALNGCKVSSESPQPSVPTGKFTAYYYDNSNLIGTETVDRPSINYSYADFQGIDSNNFHAIWKGNIVAKDSPLVLDLNFEVSWSDVSLSIDGAPIASWSNNNKIIQHTFAPGVHSIEIEYFNNWHTTNFNTSFTTNTMYTKNEAISPVSSLIDADTKIVYIGAYESGDLYNNSTVMLDDTSSKVFLFLSSYSSFNWIIENPYNVQITGISYSSSSTISTVMADSSIPTYEIDGFAYGYNNFAAPSADILYITGRTPDYTYGEYALTSTTVTGI